MHGVQLPFACFPDTPRYKTRSTSNAMIGNGKLVIPRMNGLFAILHKKSTRPQVQILETCHLIRYEADYELYLLSHFRGPSTNDAASRPGYLWATRISAT
jgi:hypothetical protein